jgi:chemotaxis protein methyltransferase CheR
MPLAMTDKEFALLAAWVRAASGNALGPDKRYLMEARLDDLREEAGCATWGELHQALLSADRTGDRALGRKAIDCITTHETFFFRDKKTYELFKLKLIPELLGDDLGKPVAIWSAACSTGQESYSLAMALEEILFDLSKCRIRIFGTDLSEAAVMAANKGEFNKTEMGRGLDERQIGKYFVRAGERYKVRDDLRGLCRFQVDNLLTNRPLGPFDVVFCRNVLIYFAPDDRRLVVESLARTMRRGSVLLLGATENLAGVSDRFKAMEYRGANYYTLL